MSHADQLILEVRAALAATYPAIAACLKIDDESAGDFGIAHYRGLVGGCAYVTFDAGRQPAPGVVAHELWHDAHRGAGGSPFWMLRDDPVLVGYWQTMAYTTSLPDAITQAIARERELGTAAAWPYYTGEQMADAFAWVTYSGRGWGGADPGIYGGSYAPEHLARLDTFFRAVRPLPAPPPPQEVEDMDRATFDRWWIENMRQQVTPTVVALKDAFNDHDHTTPEGRTSGPIVHLGNEP